MAENNNTQQSEEAKKHAESKRSFAARKERRSRANLIVGLTTLLLVVILVCFMGWFFVTQEEDVIQGEVDANEVRVSSKIPARIQSFKVEEGQMVKEGDTLVLLSSPELYAKLQQAEAAKAAAKAQSHKAQNGAQQEQIEAAYQMWQKAKINLDIMKKSYERVKKLYEGEVVSAQKFDETEAQYNAAVATERAAKTQYDMAKNGARAEDKKAALAVVDRAQGAVDEVEAYLPEVQLLAPISGEISEVFPKQGELVGQGAPIMNIIDLDNLWVTINIREDKLSNFKKGQKIQAIVPALDNKEITLVVTYIKALGTYATWRATKTSGDWDVKTFEVHAKPTAKVPDLRPGMSVLIKEKE